MKKDAIAKREGNSLQTSGPNQLMQLALEMAAADEQMTILVGTCVKITRPPHWVDFQGKPYLESDGCEWIAARAGFDIRSHPKETVRTQCEDDKGTYHQVQVPVTVTDPRTGRSVTMTGVSSTRDKLFGTYKSDGVTHIREESDVDSSNILRKAEANGVHRAFVAFLGMDGLTWDDITAIKGEDIRPRLKEVLFQKGGRSQKPNVKSDSKAPPPTKRPQGDAPKDDRWGPPPDEPPPDKREQRKPEPRKPEPPIPGGLVEMFERKINEREPGSDDEKE